MPDLQLVHTCGQGTNIHPHGALETKPWGQTEFALLDPDHDPLTFGQSGLEPL